MMLPEISARNLRETHVDDESTERPRAQEGLPALEGAKAVDVSAGDGTRSPRPSSTPTTSWFGNPLSALAGIGEVSALESFNQ